MILHVEHGSGGFHMPQTPELLTAIQFDPPPPPHCLHTHFGLSWPPGQGLGHWQVEDGEL